MCHSESRPPTLQLLRLWLALIVRLLGKMVWRICSITFRSFSHSVMFRKESRDSVALWFDRFQSLAEVRSEPIKSRLYKLKSLSAASLE